MKDNYQEMAMVADKKDREAAWPFRPECYTESDKERWMSGLYDHSAKIIMAFARHRQIHNV